MTAFFGKLLVLVRPYRVRLILGLICGIVFAFTNIALAIVVNVTGNLVFGDPGRVSLDRQLARAPGFVRPLLESLAASMPQLQAPSSKWGLVLVICLIPAVWFFRGLCNYLNIYLVNWASVRAVADLRTKLFDHLQNLPLGFFSRASTGDLISRIASDTQVLQGVIGNALASIIRDPITILSLLAFLSWQQPALTLVSLVALPMCIVPIAIYARKVRRSASAMQTHVAELSGLMHESFTGNRIIKAYNLEETALVQFKATTKKYVGHVMRVLRANEMPGSVTEFLGSVGVALVFLYIVFQADQTRTPGDFFSFIGSIFLMYQPVKTLTRLHNQLEQARAASGRVFELLDTTNPVVDPPTPVPLDDAGTDIHFDNVDFAYDRKPVLRGINLTVKAGELIALVGSSGSGKTTLVNLLPRFYDPQCGTVRIGRTDIRRASIKHLRCQIALVTQETILFHDTIRHNIEAGRPGATDADIETAARHANAHEFILQQPQGYGTVVGEKGAMLSGGQRQRIAIARAVLKNAPILILDEATSALDAESERAVQSALEELMQGRTTICIAHRLSTVQRADRIVVLAEGRIVETGTHAELMQRQGSYFNLYKLQFDLFAG